MTETNGFGTHISLALPRQYNINRATTTEHSYLAYYYANTARSFTSELPFTSPPPFPMSKRMPAQQRGLDYADY
ncbi:hypothetical protein A3Q41_04930 (plasmid) [Rhodococcoides fascians]|uniref:Uncharacterized protein n=1 Tax=Rhodococcoides fascians TaxID=1828 RepID=A0A143QSQ7_RHOFA|nr:hypothetical protein A3Q41_04930 [Rhodococcus fascians]